MVRSRRDVFFKAMVGGGEEEREKRKHMWQWEEREEELKRGEREIFMLYIERVFEGLIDSLNLLD